MISIIVITISIIVITIIIGTISIVTGIIVIIYMITQKCFSATGPFLHKEFAQCTDNVIIIMIIIIIDRFPDSQRTMATSLLGMSYPLGIVVGQVPPT